MTAYMIADIGADDQHPILGDDGDRAPSALRACLPAASAADRYAGSAPTTVTVITNSQAARPAHEQARAPGVSLAQ
jgi:hypothetical protein